MYLCNSVLFYNYMRYIISFLNFLRRYSYSVQNNKNYMSFHRILFDLPGLTTSEILP